MTNDTPTPIVIGLTGTIGAGKSAAAHILAGLGAHHIDFDALVAHALTTQPVIDAIAEKWGSGVLTPDGQLDRAALADVAFASDDSRKALEAIVHPAIWRTRPEVIAAARAAGAPAALMDAPLLYEVGLDAECDTVIVIDAPRDIRLARVAERGWDDAELARREAAQWSGEQKRGRAEHVVDNAGTLEELTARLTVVYSDLTGGA